MTPTYTLAPTQIANGEQCSWYEFADKIFELLGMKPDLAPTTTAEFGAKACRPACSVLAYSRLFKENLKELQGWSNALEAYLKKRRPLG